MEKQFTITLNTDSELYQELEEVVADINKQGLGSITMEQYIGNIVNNWLETRVRETYHAKLRQLPISEMKSRLGEYKQTRQAIRSKKNG